MTKGQGYRVAVVGATGVVGEAMCRVLSERCFPVREYAPLATDSSSGKTVKAFGRSWEVRAAAAFDFHGWDVALFTAGARTSEALVPRALERGCRVVDNTSAFRMRPDVPLVVPEINRDAIGPDDRLVACPNCTTIVLVMSLAPLLRATEIRRVVVTSFQSVSGAGRDALDELEGQSRGSRERKVFPKAIGFNCIPMIGEVQASGYTHEEEKIIEESRKILDRPDLAVVATAVRVPVRVGHAVSVNVETADELPLERAVELWRSAPGVEFADAIPTQLDVAGRDAVAVGRLRRDSTRPHALSYWAVGDNLRKGAATNSVQIAEILFSMQTV